MIESTLLNVWAPATLLFISTLCYFPASLLMLEWVWCHLVHLC